MNLGSNSRRGSLARLDRIEAAVERIDVGAMDRSLHYLTIMRALGLSDMAIASTFAMNSHWPLPNGVRRMPKAEAAARARKAAEYARANMPNCIRKAMDADAPPARERLACIAWKLGWVQDLASTQVELDDDVIDLRTGATICN